YRTDGLRMILEGGGVTEMACSQPQGVMEQEELFLDYLHQVDQFILSEDGLQLITGDGDVIIFVPRK
ncbi:MAG: META domain-containing protein, partial [Chloroflexota bacterium]